MTSHMGSFRERIKAYLEQENLTVEQAARQIGVPASALRRHLDDGYIRSDSEARYRLWMEGQQAQSPSRPPPPLDVTRPTTRKAGPRDVALFDITEWRPERALNVVDVFSGAGGLSLGFDLTGGGAVFSTVMALDINESMVRVFNNNHVQELGSRYKVARRVDMSDFFNEAEVLTFYLDHYAELRQDTALRESLRNLAGIGVDGFMRQIARIDHQFLESLAQIRRSEPYIQAWNTFDTSALAQTSVIGFHDVLKLPMTGRGNPVLKDLLWSSGLHHLTESKSEEVYIPSVSTDLQEDVRARLVQLWHLEMNRLTGSSTGNGKGQLASAARKIGSFLAFINSDVHLQIQEAWLNWRTARDSLRIHTFGNEEVWGQLQELYTSERKVAVVVGGPPCQGFSRIGRGKIRSLRDQSVHVQYDAQAGDRRNYLMRQYVLFIGALAPDIFVFENVRHFQAKVKTPEGTFSAPEVLGQSIEEISHNGVRYEVARRILDATRHCIPQTRERFFMVGVAERVRTPDAPAHLAKWLLQLPEREVVVLRPALEGLPEPFYASVPRSGKGIEETIHTTLEPRQGNQSEDIFINWLRQPLPAGWPEDGRSADLIDAHHARIPRQDDQQFFKLMGPGTRWMDYRSDNSDTLKALQVTLDTLLTVLSNDKSRLPVELATLDVKHIEELRTAVDGSLSLRLLLENIKPAPGELRHHLAGGKYLSKRESQHGDWLARMSADQPSKTMMSHMGKDTYAFVHPWRPRTISVREAARIQTFPDWYRFGSVGLVDAFTIVGNAVPPLLSSQLALRVAQILALDARALADQYALLT
ncbi:DNA cytosine methyltransferase [Deinococcus petrolearius]|uniref:DNA (cytosine-5-)-methyltransferase n=1 Tax=Deinococcus petrolearius TaxID=1751295 RepID=A0ABW1DKH7_9DEIO